nr:MAG TPA: hypothetical protein [Caudoviricetes sp.]
MHPEGFFYKTVLKIPDMGKNSTPPSLYLQDPY